MWLVALTLSSIVVFLTYIPRRDSTFVEPSYSNAAAASYNGLSKILWGLMLMWVTVACVKGYGGKTLELKMHFKVNYNYQHCVGIINSFLAWGFFKPLAKMNYVTFLTHLGLIESVFFAITYSVEFTDIIAVSIPFARL